MLEKFRILAMGHLSRIVLSNISKLHSGMNLTNDSQKTNVS